MSAFITIKTALISVSDKTGLAPFALTLHRLGIKILSTGGTSRYLKENNIPVVDVSDYTQFPEILDGRVKTLHPKIHGGLLRRPGIDDAILNKHAIDPIDLVVVNLYPFEQVIQRENVSLEEAIENIDIGGPTMLRAGAKNYKAVSVVVNITDYPLVLDELEKNNGAISLTTRFNLACKAFAHTAKYDAAITHYLNSINVDQSTTKKFPEIFNCQFVKKQDLRYGENPHQSAAFYKDLDNPSSNVANARQWQGKELSFNNIADTDTALECVRQFVQPACVIVKHANPCGVALGENLLQAYERAFSTDPTSAFGGIIAFNEELTPKVAELIIEKQFVEVLIAPTISSQALAILANKPNIRVLTCGDLQNNLAGLDFKRVNGGLLIQDQDIMPIDIASIEVVTKRKPTSSEQEDLLFAWKVAQFVKSNAIVYAKENMTIGIGAGQMSRVYSARIAAIKAEDVNLIVAGSVMASDAFFPFRDSIDTAASIGIRAIIQPGGSIRDNEVIAAADEHDIAMVFTKVRHFRH